MCEVQTKYILLFALDLFCKFRAMNKVINRPRVSLEVRVQSRPNQCEIYGTDNIRETGFSSSISVFSWQY